MDKRLADVLTTAGFHDVGGSVKLWTTVDEREDVWWEFDMIKDKGRWRYRYENDDGYTRIKSATRVETVIGWIQARVI